MDIFFTCAGNASRWNFYKNNYKHLVEINNEPLLVRLTKQFCFGDQHILVKKEHKTDYEKVVQSNWIEIDYDTSKIHLLLSVAPYLKRNSLVVLGDVYFTDEAVDKIKKMIETNPSMYMTFGRKGENLYTKCPYGELFCFYIPEFYIKTFTSFVEITQIVVEQYKMKRFSGWEIITIQKYFNTYDHEDIDIKLFAKIYKEMDFLNFVEINDQTDDIDFPQDYENLIICLN